MSNKFFKPHSHPFGKGAAKKSIPELLEEGTRYAEKHHERYPYLETARRLEALANVSERTSPETSRHFRSAADEAFKIHDQYELHKRRYR